MDQHKPHLKPQVNSGALEGIVAHNNMDQTKHFGAGQADFFFFNDLKNVLLK